jgi:hypothetical protein
MSLNDLIDLFYKQKGQVVRPFMITTTLRRMMAHRSSPAAYAGSDLIFYQILAATIKSLIWTQVLKATFHWDVGSISLTVADTTILLSRKVYGQQVH